MNASLSAVDLDLLSRVTTPTVANALERLGLGYTQIQVTDGSLKCVFPELGAMVGYACTATIRSAQHATSPRFTSRQPYWDHLANYPAPRILVAQDLDRPPAGAYWGEVNATIHARLGCVGVITDGTVRDLDEVRRLGFRFWSAGISVTHAHCHLEDFDQPVVVGGMRVTPGDLIHADLHGALVIPQELAPAVPTAVREVERYEKPMIDLCRSAEFTTAALADLLRNETV